MDSACEHPGPLGVCVRAHALACSKDFCVLGLPRSWNINRLCMRSDQRPMYPIRCEQLLHPTEVIQVFLKARPSQFAVLLK